MIVDDEPDILLMLRFALDSAGFDTVLASDGATALRRIEEEQPDVVLLDVMMPILDGWSTLERIRSRPRSPKVIVVTAKRSAADAVRAYELGAVKYVTKPFDPQALVDTIRSVTGEARARA
jgi:two-component system OmpR family response regulator/two-component system alkaline phosphatase synthesis response regulator PhoP